MKIHLLKENLQIAVGLVSRFTAKKAQLPILSHVGMKTEGKELYFMGTDASIGVSMRVGGKVVEEGSVAVPSRVLSELSQSLPLGTVELSVGENDSLKVGVGSVSSKIQGMPLSEFPEVEAGEGIMIGAYDVEELGYVVDRLTHAISSDETRPVLTGVYWLHGKGLMVATDGYRLSVVEGKMKAVSDEIKPDYLLVAGQVLQEAVKVMSDLKQSSVEVFYAEKQKQVVFKGSDVVVVGRVLQGEYPKFDAILPKKTKVNVLFERESLLQAVKLAAVFAKDSAHIVTINLFGDSAEVAGKTAQLGENTTQVEYISQDTEVGSKETEGMLVAFNSRYLVDCLSRMNGDSVWLKINDPLAPALFMEENDKNYRHVIMPMRIQD